jgi:hypothetical protein
MLKDAFYRLFLLEELGAPAAGQDYLGPSPYPYNSSSSFLQASSSENLPSVLKNNIMKTTVKLYTDSVHCRYNNFDLFSESEESRPFDG